MYIAFTLNKAARIARRYLYGELIEKILVYILSKTYLITFLLFISIYFYFY